MKTIHPGHLEHRFCIFGCQILCITYLAIMPQLPPIPAVETPADNIVPSPEKQNDPGQPVRKPFKCEQCDFSSDTKHGLSVHNGKAHRPEPASERLLSICNRCDEFYYPSDSNYQSNPIHQIYCDNCMLLM